MQKMQQTKNWLAQPKAPKMQKCKNQATIKACLVGQTCHINKLVNWVWYPRGRRLLVVFTAARAKLSELSVYWLQLSSPKK
jgi:hypothetical protein